MAYLKDYKLEYMSHINKRSYIMCIDKACIVNIIPLLHPLLNILLFLNYCLNPFTDKKEINVL